jgi:hypothetical protein
MLPSERQHEKAIMQMLAESEAEIVRLRTQRDALLEAVRYAVNCCGNCANCRKALTRAIAACEEVQPRRGVAGSATATGAGRRS